MAFIVIAVGLSMGRGPGAIAVRQSGRTAKRGVSSRGSLLITITAVVYREIPVEGSFSVIGFGVIAVCGGDFRANLRPVLRAEPRAKPC